MAMLPGPRISSTRRFPVPIRLHEPLLAGISYQEPQLVWLWSHIWLPGNLGELKGQYWEPHGYARSLPFPWLGSNLLDSLFLSVKEQAPLQGGHKQHFLAVIQLHNGRWLLQHKVWAADTLRESQAMVGQNCPASLTVLMQILLANCIELKSILWCRAWCA